MKNNVQHTAADGRAGPGALPSALERGRPLSLTDFLLANSEAVSHAKSLAFSLNHRLTAGLLAYEAGVFGLGHGLLRSSSPKAQRGVTEVYYYVVNL